MPEPEFGILDRIDPRQIWGNEVIFSSWLIENFNMLEEVLDIEVEDLEPEVSVGPFRCDITGVDKNTEKFVVVENQYGLSDHDHLGKLLTYAAGNEAGVIVWIAEDFRDEHLSVLDWLNKEMEDIAFFGTKLEVIRIDESKPVPLFKVLSKPDEWQRTIRTERSSERNRSYGEYFNLLLEKLKNEIPNFTTLQRAPPKSRLQIKTSKSGIVYRIRFNNRNGYQIEIFIRTRDRERNKAYFDSLYSQKDRIEEITGALVWDRLDDNKPCRISLSIEDTTILEVLEDPAKLEDTLSWSVEYAKKFKEAFTPLIKNL